METNPVPNTQLLLTWNCCQAVHINTNTTVHSYMLRISFWPLASICWTIHLFLKMFFMPVKQPKPL